MNESRKQHRRNMHPISASYLDKAEAEWVRATQLRDRAAEAAIEATQQAILDYAASHTDAIQWTSEDAIAASPSAQRAWAHYWQEAKAAGVALVRMRQ